ncbi:hypothetical protein [Bergeyella sp. RCAD1439]|uniref:hypothetical protein n=1 Tax=Bergeyella anatis TaxID=3113737 RepID=UPI002E18CD14|nr:hypothetical protein [Bergeyella sp. RCAD1439]
MSKTAKIILVIALLPPFIFMGYYFFSGVFSNKTSKQIYLDGKKELSYGFKIDTIYRDRRGHNALTLANNERDISITSAVEWENGIFRVGDSITKQKDSLKIYLYRNKKLDTVLDYSNIYIREDL